MRVTKTTGWTSSPAGSVSAWASPERCCSLDPETSRAVLDLLTDIAHDKNIPILINIHELELALEYSDRLVGLTDGELVFEGTPSDFDDEIEDRIYRDGEPSKRRAAQPDPEDETDGKIIGSDVKNEQV